MYGRNNSQDLPQGTRTTALTYLVPQPTPTKTADHSEEVLSTFATASRGRLIKLHIKVNDFLEDNKKKFTSDLMYISGNFM